MGACAVGLGATPAAADAPDRFFVPGTPFGGFDNPCTGLPMVVTIDAQVTVHQHRNNFVGHMSRTGTTSDGYVMDHGVDNFVDNGNVVREAFTDHWRHPDGSKFKVQGGFVFDIASGELKVDRPTDLRCIGG